MPFLKEIQLKLFHKLILPRLFSLELDILLKVFTWRSNVYDLALLFLYLEKQIRQPIVLLKRLLVLRLICVGRKILLGVSLVLFLGKLYVPRSLLFGIKFSFL
jgi:hypothetical protein